LSPTTRDAPSHLSDDERGFLAAPDRRLLDEGYILLDYRVETWDDPWKAAVHFCREQSTALWHRPGVDEDYRPRHAALLVELEVEAELERPSVTELERPGRRFRRVWWRIAHPTVNFGPRLPNLLTAAGGEGAYFTPSVPLVRLEEIHLPEAWLESFEGPRFGVAGLRELLGVHDRPFICGVIKPNIGMPIDPFAELAYQALRGGADIVKDDEMLADTSYSPLVSRAARVFPKVRQAQRETGERKMYLVNITDEVHYLNELHDIVVAVGQGNAAVMLNALPVGIGACRMVARRARVPVFSHFDLIAAMSRVPFHGVSSVVWTRLQRIAGLDAIIMPGLSERMNVAPAEVVANLKACLEPMGRIRPSLPLPGGSDWAGTVKNMFETFATVDFGIVPGRGIFGHPSGPAEGARSLREAWTLVSRGDDPADPAVQTASITEAYREFAS
jgi:ribulose-bisphosphate carboxylase large chain